MADSDHGPSAGDGAEAGPRNLGPPRLTGLNGPRPLFVSHREPARPDTPASSDGWARSSLAGPRGAGKRSPPAMSHPPIECSLTPSTPESSARHNRDPARQKARGRYPPDSQANGRECSHEPARRRTIRRTG
jgi:hypothetical protein